MTTTRIAGAPITWGVCEVPGWGHQLDRERVLDEMRGLGLAATEFGPEGFLPAAPAERAAVLASHGLRAVGGFVPLVLHRADDDPLPAVERELEAYAAAGAEVLVVSAATGVDGYEAGRPVLDEAGWAVLLGNLERIRAAAGRAGVRAVLHPHVGTMVERADELERVLTGSDMPLCLDTGHLLIGGADPLDIATRHTARIAHAHLKDVDAALADRVRAGELGYHEAVTAGMYRPLGRGDARIAEIVALLRGAGYDGWFVLEQDTVLEGAPAAGDGPVADAGESAAFLRAQLGTD